MQELIDQTTEPSIAFLIGFGEGQQSVWNPFVKGSASFEAYRLGRFIYRGFAGGTTTSVITIEREGHANALLWSSGHWLNAASDIGKLLIDGEVFTVSCHMLKNGRPRMFLVWPSSEWLEEVDELGV